MIFQRALQRELVSAAGATFTVLFTIMVTWTLISILGQAAGGRVASSDVIALIAFSALNYLPTLLILTSFISVLAVVTRSYRDSEMVVWFASGLSLARWIRPVLAFGLPLVLLTAGLSLFATPWAKMQYNEYVQRFEKREDLQKVSPGQFRESSSTNRIFFVEGVSGDAANVQNVFVNTFENGANTVVVAKEGVIEADAKGDRFLVLRNGRRYQGVPGQADFQTMEFDRYSMRVTTQAAVLDAEHQVNAMSIGELLSLRTSEAMAELLWRIASPITCLLLVLLAIPLGFVNPRAGSSANLIIALLIFFSYSNLTKLVESSVKQSHLSFAMGWWPLHLGVAVCVAALFSWRLNVNHRYHPLVLWAALKRGQGRAQGGVGMKILQRYFAVSIAQAVLFVLLAFLGLLSFMDLTGELPSVGKGDYAVQHAFLYVLMLLPSHVYEVMPVAALIGTIYTMAQFASSSEFTIMRASSMSTLTAIWMLFKIGIVLVAITFVFGELITPLTTPLAEKMRLAARGATVSQEFRSGMWSKDIVRSDGVTGAVTGSRFFNVREFRNDGQLVELKLYEFDTNFRLRSLITASRASYQGENVWRLFDVTQTLFSNSRVLPRPGTPMAPGTTVQSMFSQDTSAVATTRLASKDLVSEITPKILSVSSTDPDRMSANELAVYTRHLAENRQETERFKIAFWKKLIDPLAIFVLMALALPFAYLHSRSGGISLKIFIGIMIGVSFLLTNTLFSHLGLLSTWPAFVTAIAPSSLYLLMAVGALWWVERH